MCGIVCYVGQREARPVLMEWLKRLGYREFDSAGVAIQNSHQIHFFRSVRRILELEQKINGTPILGTRNLADP